MRVRVLCAVGVLLVACGSSNDSSGPPGNGDGGTGGDGSPGGDPGGGDGGNPGGGDGGGGGPSAGASVLMHHNHANRDGLFVQPTLTKAAAKNVALDKTFDGTYTGNVYAQPLYVEIGPSGKGTFYVTTENDTVIALDETTGKAVWTKTLGTAAGDTGAGCGNIKPLGITGTPVIDFPARTLYVDAVDGNANTIITHKVHAISIDDGSERAGWPVDVSNVSSGTVKFHALAQNERGALALVNGTVYVPYGGHAGDCNDYHGWVVGIPTADPAHPKGYATPSGEAGSWAPGGLASDGTNIFATTGNGNTNTWAGNDAILRFQAGPVFSGKTTDYFAPSNWKDLDRGDVDLGGTGPMLVDVAGSTPSKLVVALGKNGVAYLIDRTNLGGVGKGNGTTGEGVASAQVVNGEIINAPATVTTSNGTFVILHGHGENTKGVNCPAGQQGDLVGLKIVAGAPPSIKVAWCQTSGGQGSPIVTTTDGASEAIVWTAGAEGDGQLHAWDAETGQAITGVGTIKGLRHFTTLIAVKGRILAAADNHMYAFK